MRLALAAVALAACLACGGGEAEPVVVSAASSLTDAFTELADAFEQRTGVEVELNLGSSSALATQIVEGAPAHVFAAANLAQVQVVVDAGLAEAPRTFAHNRIVVVVPAGNEAVRSFEDLARPGVRVVLAGPEVPAGDYARQAIEAKDAEDAGFAGAVLGNVVSEESSVRAVLTKVELGEADAGMVYATDAAVAGDAVRAVPVPEAYAPAAEYSIVALSEAGEDAEAFVDFVLSEDGRAILARWGFQPAP